MYSGQAIDFIVELFLKYCLHDYMDSEFGPLKVSLGFWKENIFPEDVLYLKGR